MSNFKIRRADHGDIPFIVRLYNDGLGYGHYAESNISPDIIFYMAISGGCLPMSSGITKIDILICMIDDSQAGFAAIKEDTNYSLSEMCELWMFSIDPKYRRQGVGLMFLDNVCTIISNTSTNISARTLQSSTVMAMLLANYGFIMQNETILNSMHGPIPVKHWLKSYPARQENIPNEILANKEQKNGRNRSCIAWLLEKILHRQ